MESVATKDYELPSVWMKGGEAHVVDSLCRFDSFFQWEIWERGLKRRAVLEFNRVWGLPLSHFALYSLPRRKGGHGTLGVNPDPETHFSSEFF